MALGLSSLQHLTHVVFYADSAGVINNMMETLKRLRSLPGSIEFVGDDDDIAEHLVVPELQILPRYSDPETLGPDAISGLW